MGYLNYYNNAWVLQRNLFLATSFQEDVEWDIAINLGLILIAV
jgi:hypothetical protein